MPTYLKSLAAADRLGVTYERLFGLIRRRKIAAPLKDSSGDYVWTEADLAAARKALQQDRRRKGVGA